MAKASTTGVKTYTAAQQAIKDQMTANSLAWHSADPAERARLVAANQALAGQLGGSVVYDDITGTWSGAAANPDTVASAQNVVTHNANQAAIVAQMNANSQEWHRADPAQRAALEQANRQLAAQLGGSVSYDDYSGTWSGTAAGMNINTLNPYGVQPRPPELQGLALGDMYGLTYDYDTILGKLNAATKAAYAVKEQEATQMENQYYNQLINAQAGTLDALRRAQASAIATGASKGMAAANELSSVLGLQQTMAPIATDLANNRENIISQKQAAMEKNAASAIDVSNAVKQAIAGLDSTKYGYDTQSNIGILDYLAALANASINAYASDNTLAGVKYNADQNVASAQITADANKAIAGAGTGAGTGTGTGVGTGAPETPPPDKDDVPDDAYTMPDGVSYITFDEKEGYIYHGPDAKPMTLTATQNEIVRREGTIDALDPNYVVNELSPFIKKGSFNKDTKFYVDDLTWRWDAVAKVWRAGDKTMSVAEMKARLEILKAEEEEAARENTKTPKPWEIPWDKQTPTTP